jgi:putative phosphoribosyl transferase
MTFIDRADAGRQLAERLGELHGDGVVVLALPRGGVPVAFEVAKALGAPLDIIMVRKLGVPFHPELGMGAIGEEGVRVIDDDIVRLAGVSEYELDEIESREREELERRAGLYRAGRSRVPLEGRTAIIVDDGIATGSTARAACRVARAHGARHVIMSAPVGPAGCESLFATDADAVACLTTPEEMFAIGQFYEDFSQTSDAQVVGLLEQAASRFPQPIASADAIELEDLDAEVTIAAAGVRLRGHLRVPPHARGVVMFAHGSGSSRHSPRNQFVASVLQSAGLGTLLFDLLTPGEELERANVFDLDLLTARLTQATAWLRSQSSMETRAIGYFGASTGAAAALSAAARRDSTVAAVVSRGGRPDLAIPHLALVRAPTLLIVGSEDHVVLRLNREAQTYLHCENRLAIVPGATHLFEEAGTLDEAAALARDWFVTHLAPTRVLNH